MKIATALAAALFAVLPAAAWSQDAPVKIDFSRLLPQLDHALLIAAVKAALSQPQFQSASGIDVLTLTAPDGVSMKGDQITFTVVFSRDDRKLGEAFESCPRTKLSDCTDQLVLDTRTAAK